MKPDWTTLNAYVDGELDAGAAAAVADAAGRDPAVAEQIALLYSLKGVTHGALPQAPADLHLLLPPRRRLRPALAAAVALLIVVGAIVAVSMSVARAPALPIEALDTARSLHLRWLDADAARPQETPPVVLLAALSRFGQVPMVPDLESTELKISLLSVADEPGGRVLQVGYRGARGCHLSLFVFTDDRMPKARAEFASGRDQAYGWRVNDLGYLLFARGMDPSRLALIAAKVEEATRANVPLGPIAREQLAQNKRNSTHCQA